MSGGAALGHVDLKHRSRALTEGPERAAARAYLKGIGFDDDALAKPLIGVAHCWIETMPCNFNHRALAAKVKEGVRAAGGTPMELNTVAISDGITMGTSGMKTSLVSREVIADSIELVARGHLFDALVVLSGCDKTIPGTVMALARLDIPGVMLYGGSIRPGRFHGRDVTIQDVFEAVGAHATGRMTDEELLELEDVASPGAGACGGPVHGQHDGDGLRGARHLADGLVDGPRRARLQGGRRGRGRAAGHRRPARDMAQPDHHARGLENAIAAVAGSGGSTNAVLHLLAVAREIGVELSIDDFDAISERTPLLCDLKPGGRYVATDLYEAGGVPLVAKRLLEAGLLHEDAMTVTGRTVGEHAREAAEARPARRAPARRPAQGERRPGDPARQPRARGLRGQALRPRAPPPRRARRGSSTARRRRWTPCLHGGIQAGDVVVIRNEGPAGGPGCARCWPSPRRSTAPGWASTSRC